MAGWAKSQLKKSHTSCWNHAIQAYDAKKQKKILKQHVGLCTICRQFEEMYYDETSEIIKLCHMTLKCLAEGGMTWEEANQDRSWLNETEAKILIDFINEMAGCGFPYSHKHVKEAVDMVVSARWGDRFPVMGVGVNWTYQFAKKHADQLKVSWARSLEDKRGQAANPHNNSEFWKILKDVKTKYSIEPKNIYGSDEVGIQPQGQGEHEFVFGPHGKSFPYQQCSGTHENITVIVTICTNGTTTPPAIIFKGKAYNVKWGEDNPLNALYKIFHYFYLYLHWLTILICRLGYQQKGWTDGEIGAEWIKHFDKATCTKANGKYRLLIVDGHNSHYTIAFLQYAWEHMIIVICYPAHSTHLYQGLDVMIFSVLKLYLGQEHDAWFKATSQPIDKNNFLRILSKAYVSTLMPEHVKTAFWKTGIHPFNPSMITSEMLATSKDTSVEAHLPATIKSTPESVQIIVDLMHKLQVTAGADTEINAPAFSGDIMEIAGDCVPDLVTQITRSSWSNPATVPCSTQPSTSTSLPTTTTLQILEEAVTALKKTNSNFLVSPIPTTSSDPAPCHTSCSQCDMSGTINTCKATLMIEPKTANKLLLLSALHESKSNLHQIEVHAFKLQASNILNEAYTSRLKHQLAMQEEKNKNKNKNKVIKLVGDGSPCLLTADDFYELVKEKEKEVQDEARRKGEWKEARGCIRMQ